MKNSEQQTEVINKYLKIVAKKKAHPTRAEMIRVGVSRDKVHRLFGSFAVLRDLAKKENPSVFDGVIDQEVFSPRNLKKLEGEISHYKRFILTTVVPGQKPHKAGIKSLKTMAKALKAKLLFQLAIDPAHNLDGDPDLRPDPFFAAETLVVSDLQLNSNFFISNVRVGAKQINPLHGLKRIGQRTGSFVVASPKQCMETVAVAENKLPRILLTAGACTIPNYSTTRFVSERTAYVAEEDHQLGALIIEIVDNRRYHFRHVQIEPSGNIVDFGIYYQGDRISKLPPSVFSIADWHTGETDPQAKKAWFECSDQTGCKTWVLHDLFNGKSVNHHDKNKLVTLTKRAELGQLLLAEEFKLVAKNLIEIIDHGISVVVARSNHDDFLDKWLESGDFLTDPYNLRIALKLFEAKLDGKNVLQFGVEEFGGLPEKYRSKIKWLLRTDSYKVAGIEYGAHGDKGANGSKASVTTLENGYGRGTFGHAHSPSIVRQIYTNGTSSYLKVDFNRDEGPSSWLHASTLGYKNGSRQLVVAIEGEYTMPD